MEPYKLSIKELFFYLKTTKDGLTTKEAELRLKKYGLNSIRERGTKNPTLIFLSQFINPLILTLIIAGLITYIFNEYKDTLVILIAVLSNAIIGFFQEFSAERRMHALKKMLVQKSIVIREGVEIEVPSKDLVPGDLVLLSAGAKIPADMRVIEGNDLTVDESALTGESLSVEKSAHAQTKEKLIPADQKNMVFMGTIILKGSGIGLVTLTGERTILGGIAEKVATVKNAKTPLQIKMDRFALFISGIVLTGVVIIFSTGLLKGLPTEVLFFQAIAVAVAAVPEGLPIVVTIAMAIGVQKMAKKNTIIRTLQSVETLGSTTVICSDKTGTLTQNQMTVESIFDGIDEYSVTGVGYEGEGEILKDNKPVKFPHDGLRTLLQIGVLSNESVLYKKNGRVFVNGDPTEGALIVSGAKAGIHQNILFEKHNLIDILPFNSGQNFMASIYNINNEHIMMVKGAPEEIVKRSNKVENGSFEKHEHMSEHFAKKGLRVLAMAYKKVPKNLTKIRPEDCHDLILCGLQGMMDPPRAEVITAIKGCQNAGIRVIMITGDHAITAKAIGETLGICHKNGEVISGIQLEEMSDTELFSKVEEVSIFARVSPNHKLRIVQQLIKRGEIVAVTGDGVNDAPALKASHLGIAMGQAGTDVSKEAANMVLKDDNFASIFQAVYEGRVVFENIRKAVAFLIPIGFATIITLFTTTILGLPTPFLPAQLLWINLVASGVQDLALAFEPGDKSVLLRPPRNPNEGIMSKLLLQRSVLVGLFISIGVILIYYISLNSGQSIEVSRTLAVTTMVVFQFFQVLNARSESMSVFKMNPFSNRFLIIALLGSAIAHIFVLYVPALEWLFSMQALSLREWLMITITASSVIMVVELDKIIRKKIEARRGIEPLQ